MGVRGTLLRGRAALEMSRMAEAGEDDELGHLRITGLEAAGSILGGPVVVFLIWSLGK